MPYKSDKQRHYIYAAARRGEAWAIKFIRDAGETPPKAVKGGGLSREMKKKRRHGRQRGR